MGLFLVHFLGYSLPRSGNRNWFLNGQKELPSRSFSSCFLHAATVGGRGVCVLQTCTRMRSLPAKPHTAARRAPRHEANGCVDMPSLRRSVNLTVTCSARRRHWGQGSLCKLRFGTKMLSKATSHQKDMKMVSFGKYRHAGKASSFPARRKAVQIRRDLRPSETAARWQDRLDPAGFSNGFVKFIEKCVAGRKGLKSRVNSCILKIEITAGPDRWSAGVMDGSRREGVIKKSRKVNTEERDLVGRTAAHGAHQQTIR